MTMTSQPEPAETREESGCSGHGWGFIAVSVDDAPQCINDCRERFLKDLLPKDETFHQLCQMLADMGRADKEQPFHALYCCDSQLCGVDNLGSGGKDPNVNWVINTCQNIGYHSIIDPGPPEPTYTCRYDLINEDDPRCQRAKSAIATNSAPAPAIPEDPLRTSQEAFSVEAMASRTLLAVDPSATLTRTRSSAMADETHSAISDPSLSANWEQPDKDEEGPDDVNGFPTGIKVTVVLSVIIGLFALLALVIYLLRRRAQTRSMTTFRRNIKHPSSPPALDSPTALMFPAASHTDADGVPLTPPPRLQERKFLPTPAYQEPASPVSRPHNYAPPGFPAASPAYAPVPGPLMLPKHEKTPKIYGGTVSMTPLKMTSSSSSSSAHWTRREESMSSTVSDPTTTSIPSAFGAPLGHDRSASSPTRPTRPFDSPIYIPGLASPGPPPNRALPSTPPSGYVSPTVSSPTLVQQGDAMARNTTRRKEDSREFSSFTRDSARESNLSWGSWSAPDNTRSVAHAPRITVTPPRQTSTPVLEEKT